ncbi:MAG: zinc-dependent metalloprotease, partial [Solirubrobacterales bacterium]|nr:zinc-dependent metalloprotease [Solirubrobacterales bacterium]
MIDWRRAEQLAARVAGSPELSGPSVEQLGRLSEQSLAAVVDYAQLEPSGPVPLAEAVTRAEWISANTASLRPLLDPAVEKIGAKSGRSGSGMRLVAAATLTLEAGAVLGLLSRRVMGQYDLA